LTTPPSRQPVGACESGVEPAHSKTQQISVCYTGDSRGTTRTLPKLRISIVQYLNTVPLVRGFTHGPLQGKYELSFTVPSQCAEQLRAGAVDIAIIPAIEYQRIDNLTILPGMSIASKERVRSLLLVSKVPIQRANSIALDASSRSTQALTRILCAKLWKISPACHQAKPDLAAMLRNSDAALLIGDPALRFSIDAKLHAGLHIYDVVEQWRRLTNLPAVLAVWAARQDALATSATPEVVADFQLSLTQGRREIPQISVEAARQLRLPEANLRDYLTDNINYTLDSENLQGLERFFALSSALGITGPQKPITIASDSGTLTASL
jgi:chorismate dehydratase